MSRARILGCFAGLIVVFQVLPNALEKRAKLTLFSDVLGNAISTLVESYGSSSISNSSRVVV